MPFDHGYHHERSYGADLADGEISAEPLLLPALPRRAAKRGESPSMALQAFVRAETDWR